MDEIYQSMVQPKGRTYRDSQITSWSHYREPIDHSEGRLAGNSRVWGDASPEVQSRAINTLIQASQRAGLTPRQTAHVLAIARIESGFNPDAAAGTTSAFGLGQFIDKTGIAYGINDRNRYDVGKQAEALVAHYNDNRMLAQSRGQGEEYIYKYHHDGPTKDYGGLGLSNREVIPFVDRYEQFVLQRLVQNNATMVDDARPVPTQPQVAVNQSESERPNNNSFQNVMNVMLPSQGGVRPHITGQYGEHRANGNHGGVDFNYVGGQTGVNMRHPTVRAPVSGTVVFGEGEGSYGTVKIRDAQGNTHEILHLDSRSVRRGQQIEAGEPIGTMGGRGPNGANHYARHVHYQLRDSNGKVIDPVAYWDNQRSQDQPSRTSSTNQTSASTDDVYKQGEKGDDIRGLQTTLNLLGYRDANDNALKEDGDFGKHTKAAVEAFQKNNGLTVDGIVGRDTLESLGKQSPGQWKVTALGEAVQTIAPLSKPEQAVLLSNPSHPDHALYKQALTGIGKLPPNTFKDEQERQNTAATVAFEAKVSGLKQIDHVVLNTTNTGLFAVEGRMDDPAHHRLYVDKAQAAAQPIEKSMQQMQQETQQQPYQQQQPQPQQVREPRLSM